MSQRHRRDLVADVDSRPVNPGFRSSDADIHPAAHIDPDTTIRQRARIGRGAEVRDRAIILGDADIDDCTITGNAVIGGDAYIRSDLDWFTDIDDDAPFEWTVYRTARGYWQAGAGCVIQIDVEPDVDFSSPEVAPDDDKDQRFVAARDAQLLRVIAECDRRDAERVRLGLP